MYNFINNISKFLFHIISQHAYINKAKQRHREHAIQS